MRSNEYIIKSLGLSKVASGQSNIMPTGYAGNPENPGTSKKSYPKTDTDIFLDMGLNPGNWGKLADIYQMRGMNQHFQKYDADPNTPGMQLRYNGVDNTSKILRDPNTLKYAYHTSKIDEGMVKDYKQRVDDYLANSYKDYVYTTKQSGEAPQDIQSWKQQQLQTNFPLYSNIDKLRAIGSQVDYLGDGAPQAYVGRGNWNKQAAFIYDTAQKYLTPDGGFDMDKMQQDLLADGDAGDKLSASIQSANTLINRKDMQPIVSGLGIDRIIPQDARNMMRTYSSIGREGLQSLDFMNRMSTAKNKDPLFSDIGRQKLQTATGIVNDAEAMDRINAFSPQMYNQLSANSNRLNWLNNNYADVSNMYQMSQNPLMFILKSLFSGNPNGLYSVIDSLGKLYSPGNNANKLEWGRNLSQLTSTDFKKYTGYYEPLKLLGNIRSILGGDGIRYS